MTKMGCDYYVNPFAYFEDEGTGLCDREPTEEVHFRRIADGLVEKGFRCKEHLTLCNDQWEFVKR